ncbi:hypothetical protein psal_cds_364 [Pandoravirus salinus]|uniref:Uncharacterized protein n=1 Tax=Pandoravirus salinus TaxID=1349410 RepID=S4W1M9_9VIRU|nr:hypothetical protein psal_cds_364 [Pandoravirus salinus]AGO84025.1 hypothetical protein psal_cds_364 [Pandoravirus salinus]
MQPIARVACSVTRRKTTAAHFYCAFSSCRTRPMAGFCWRLKGRCDQATAKGICQSRHQKNVCRA